MKIIKISLIMMTVFILTACGKKEVKEPDLVEPITEVVENKTKNSQEGIEISGLQISSAGTINTVSATLDNKNNKPMTFEVVLYFKDKENRILGKNSILVENLEISTKKILVSK